MQIFNGLLGWSNKRSGLEFYEYDPKIIPRHTSLWGSLLAYIIDDKNEGCPVIVIIMDRKTTEDEMNNITEKIRRQL